MSGPLSVGFVGVGRIGEPMVRRLIAAGHPVRALGRSASTRADLAALGAAPVEQAAVVAEQASVVCVCVHTDAQVREVVLDTGLLDAMAPGSVLVLHTTGSPSTVAELVAHADGRGVEIVDAPISGGPVDIAAGRVTAFVGATASGLDAARPVLEAYADPLLHVGPPGSGQRIKLVNNAVFAANLGVLVQACEIATQLGLDGQGLWATLQHGSGSSRALAAVLDVGSLPEFAERIGEFIGKDVETVRGVAAQLGVDLGGLTVAHQNLGELLSPAHRAQLVGCGTSAPAGAPT